MGAQKVLFIGGTGRISWWCVDAAVRKGFEVHVLNRGETGIRPLPAAVRMLKGDVREVTVSKALLEAYEKEHEKYCKELEGYCTKYALPFFRTHTSIPFDELVLKIFRSGGFLR